MYETIVMQMTQEEEMLVQTKLTQILEKLGVTEEDFQRTTMFHGQDQRKGMQIMQLQNQTQGSSENDDAPKLTREKTIATFKIQQDI